MRALTVHSEQVLEEKHTEDVVGATAVHGDSTEAGLSGSLEQLVPVDVEGNGEDVGSRRHQSLDRDRVELEHGLDDVRCIAY